MLLGMHVMLEVLLVPGANVDTLLSAETLEDTNARLMTRAQVEATGFVGLDADDGEHRHFIIVRHRDQNRVQYALESHTEVRGFRVHAFDL
jgi:hypothetical protein